jgi:hypothetical protein
MKMDERRRYQRFRVRAPAVVILRDQSSSAIFAMTENLSMWGALLDLPKLIEEGSRVDITVKVASGVRLHGSGVVIRTRQTSPDDVIFSAVECDVPFDIVAA